MYASTGGKTAILGTIIDEAVRDPVVDETLAAVREATDAREVINLIRGRRDGDGDSRASKSRNCGDAVVTWSPRRARLLAYPRQLVTADAFRGQLARARAGAHAQKPART